MNIPKQLIANAGETQERRAWLAKLPATIEGLARRWNVRLGAPFEGATCSWAAAVVCADGGPAVLKVGMPHMEGADEIAGLRLWNGDPTVRLLEGDEELGAMLLERCMPGAALRSQPERVQDEVIAGLLKRLWRVDSSNVRSGFRHLSKMLQFWREETMAQAQHWPDAGLVREGLRVLETLSASSAPDVLLATDLHAGNVLRAEREPWLAIDPKPFVGDAAYDLTQHLFNCRARVHGDPIGMVKRLADLAGVDAERLRLWTFGRAAADPRADWSESAWLQIAKALAM